MIKLIGLAVLWWLGWVVVAMVINSARKKANPNYQINDGVSAFLIGVSIGPGALLPPFDDHTFGGLVGTVLFILLYLNI